ncbi:MAG: hypothetical protein EOS22_01010 [Mesorhizobium sp.]|uniref:hypothetical protein n=1 Tax=Mesorhizobium sp. TaxID=1871066 RepID=UPI000FE81850|nr:hypothetical protein [Mesorhizobium sp.]RWD33359.1 MAG: hypothetical protein EOS22_01010 [Mesorhizobium sp.]TJW69304.1 MAG: hypothetical protein E5V29_08015 [Mesorhizobium sp.]
MLLTRDMSKPDPLARTRSAKKPVTPVKLSSVRPKSKPVRVVYLRGGDPVQRAKDLEHIRRLDRAGLNEHNSKAVKVIKENFFRRYGERV